MKVLVLGAGKMVEAILTGLKGEMDLSHFYLFSPSGESAKKLSQSIGCQYLSELNSDLNPDWVWVGCKPQQLKQLSAFIGDKFSHSVFVSMLAALPEADQCKILNIKKLIRIMPNMGVKHKKGVTLISSHSAQDELKKIQSIFSTTGLAQITTETELEELTLLTGSGPALFFEFSKVLAKSFTSLAQHERELLVRMVLQGVGDSVKNDQANLDELTNAVTSKGGVTIAVLEDWRQRHFFDFVKIGIEAGKKRSVEIKENLLRS